MISEVTGVDSSYCIPDVVWNRIIPLLYTTRRKKNKSKKKTGRPRMDDMKAMSAIYYILRTGCQWNALLKARRWVVERTHSWMNRFRRLLIRWKKRIENYVGMLHLACAWITYKRGGLFA